MVTIKNIYDELGWEPADGYPKGTRIKLYGMKTERRLFC